MIQVSRKILFELSEKSDKNDLTKKYSAWTTLDQEDFDKMIKVGSIHTDSKKNYEVDSKESYWSKKYPIAIDFYPNNSCDVFSYNDTYFLVYKEFGGHIPEIRCRHIQKKMIV